MDGTNRANIKIGSNVKIVEKQNQKTNILHEFTHHLESLAGERGLEFQDHTDMKKYRDRS